MAKNDGFDETKKKNATRTTLSLFSVSLHTLSLSILSLSLSLFSDSIRPRLGRDVLHLLVQGLHVHGPVPDLHLPFPSKLSVFQILAAEPPERVLEPALVVALGEVLARVRAAGLLAPLGRVHRDRGVGEQVLELEGFHQICVPGQRAVLQPDVGEAVDNRVDALYAGLERLLRPEYRGVLLHRALEVAAHRRDGNGARSGAELLEALDGVRAGVAFQEGRGGARFDGFGDGVGARAPENDDVEERVGSEAVGPVDRGACGLSGSQQPGDDGVGVAGRGAEDLAADVCRDSAFFFF